ncbi:galactose-specific lectin nattectin-like [Nerophis lumbriciformis]|uniref:galactose-specific lectin nattectin-like n=1 Tax=Nerophis lumbriciformis TaxID=546530 RepID=UPI002AE04358|nr:galactose-specific lectin nattectin-like [Nerophis lumbriciformis]
MAVALCVFFLLCGLMTGGLCAAPPIEAPACPTNWTRLDCRCFIYQATPVTFAAAEEACQVIGGNLASIRNSLEDTLAYQLVKDANSGAIPDTWIGLFDSVEEGNFLWVDGSKSSFRNFRSDQPDDFGTAEDCVEIHRVEERWNDDGCGDLNPYICSKDLH